MRIVLLEHPRKISPDRCNDIANTPLSSCLLTGYAAGILKSLGHEVIIIEGFLDRMNYRQIEDVVRCVRPDILAVNMVYHWQEDLELYCFLEMVKNEGLASYITAYGFYPTIAFEDILRNCPAIDSVILGEVELTIAELAQAVAGGTRDGALPGLACRKNGGGPEGCGEVVFSRRPLAENLDSLPHPVRTDAMCRITEVNIQGSRGCYGGCTFCYINPFYGCGSRWRGRSPESIAAEIDSVIAERGLTDFYFTDPNFFGPGVRGQERAKRIAELLKPRKIRFGIEGRVNDIHDDTIAALVDAGLRHILIGLESGKDSSLKRMNKMTTVAQNEEAIRILRKHGIEPNIGFIMFEPEASLEDVRENLEFLKRNNLLSNLVISANVLYHHQIILKGTPAYRLLESQGRLLVGASSYEGVTTFMNPQVASLAGLMRQVTNYLFNRMAGIWGGHVEEPANSREKYAEMNRTLVGLFEESLTAMERGQGFSDTQIEELVMKTEQEFSNVLGQ